MNMKYTVGLDSHHMMNFHTTLTVDAVGKHFPELGETQKGHGRKIPCGLRLTKPKSLLNQSSLFLTGEECPILDAESKERWDESMNTV